MFQMLGGKYVLCPLPKLMLGTDSVGFALVIYCFIKNQPKCRLIWRARDSTRMQWCGLPFSPLSRDSSGSDTNGWELKQLGLWTHFQES